ncbi:DUF3164 family protein [Phenylobacterium sp.]|uniref:DUF3164 family protein n=1 Tax=Phenylobacterium sp. TaxID=1871053 RepID=UPI002731E257|nr:DUF3164 family protein [Phenylobacterium sp.]MDP1617313.1 DUF3164 family protein [Phenylobacterium sp.]MDP1985685.1 DUF3164 family protein [Phenylobacterium sp.]
MIEAQTQERAVPTPTAPVVPVNGQDYMHDVRGNLVPVAAIKTTDLLMDEVVRKIHAYATDLSDQIKRFKEHTSDDVYGFLALLAQEYGLVRGGIKGNVMLQSFDGLLRVTVQTAERVTFGPELQQAKALVDECLVEWASTSGPEIQAIVQDAFNVDKQGEVSPTRLFQLLRLKSEDPRWLRAMQAITDSIRPLGTKEYFRFHRRETRTSAWKLVVIDLAAA